MISIPCWEACIGSKSSGQWQVVSSEAILLLIKDLGNPSPPHHLITIIEHGGLARRNGALRLVEFHQGLAMLMGFHARGGAGMVVANLHVRIHRVARRQRANPIHIAHPEAAAEKVAVLSHHHAILRRVERIT